MAHDYIDLIELGPKPGAKTNRWDVKSKAGGYHLGAIRWYSPWRRYCFHPCADVLFDAACLTELSSFMAERMEERKQRRN